MRIAIIAASFALSACATNAQQASANFGSSLDGMVGQPVEVAIARLGEPIASAPMGTERVYGWGYAFTSTELLTPTPGFINEANVQSGIFPPPRRTVQNSCVVRMVVGADGLIRDWDFQGNDRGCRAYADRLAGNALARAG